MTEGTVIFWRFRGTQSSFKRGRVVSSIRKQVYRDNQVFADTGVITLTAPDDGPPVENILVSDIEYFS